MISAPKSSHPDTSDPWSARLRRFFSPSAIRVFAVLVVAGMTLATVAEAKWPWKRNRHERGEKVEFSGVVTDADGRALEGVQVALEASRDTFRLRRFRKEPVDTFRVSVETGKRGDYSLIWPWNSYYNRYELLIAVTYRKDGRDTQEILHRVDVTEATKKAAPIVTPIQVPDVTFLNSLRSFLATVDTEDEKRIYREMGRPGKIEQIGTGGSVGATWWYFDQGKLFRFEGGALKESKAFDAVKEF